MTERTAPLFMVRHELCDRLLRAVEALADDRLTDVEALASVVVSAAAILAMVERLRGSVVPDVAATASSGTMSGIRA